MSEGPREYELNYAAANELERQSRRAKKTLERLAADLAANDAERDADLKDLVERQHVERAAEFLFGSVTRRSARRSPQLGRVFISFSHEDEAFLAEVAEKLTAQGITHFKANRDIPPTVDWCETIWDAIRGCRVFLSVLTPRFIESRWYYLEGGAACASGKTVLTVLRYVDASQVLAPFDRFQAVVVENNEQLDQLVETLKNLCRE